MELTLGKAWMFEWDRAEILRMGREEVARQRLRDKRSERSAVDPAGQTAEDYLAEADSSLLDVQ